MDVSTVNTDEKTALKDGRAVPVDVDGTPCVVVRQDVFDKFKAILNDELNPRDAYAAVLKAWDKDDENPDQYLEYLEK